MSRAEESQEGRGYIIEDPRISKIRTVLDEDGGTDWSSKLPRIRAILDFPTPEATCGAWGGCSQPSGHNRGQADIPEKPRGALRRRISAILEVHLVDRVDKVTEGA